MKIYRFLFIISIMLVIPIETFAQDHEVLRLMKDYKFIIAKTGKSKKGVKVYIYNRDQLQGMGTIIVCKKSSCLVKADDRYEGFNFQLGMVVRYNERPKMTSPTSGVYGGIGGLLGYSYQGGYWYENKDNPSVRFEASLDFLSQQFKNTAATGFGTTIGGQYNLLSPGKFRLPIYARTTFSFVSLDFSQVDDNGYETPYYLINQFEGGLAAAYQVTNSMAVHFGLGMSYNSFLENYVDEDEGLFYTVAFSGVFLASNIYFYYGF